MSNDFKNRYKTWIEISKDALESNIKSFRSILSKKTKLYAVVKSNAYGHGLIEFSKLADEFGIDGFCVDSVIEGHKLRATGIKKPILVLGPTLPALFKEAAADNLTITVSNFEVLNLLAESGIALNFHLKIDTGMRRQGFYVKDLSKVIKILQTTTYNLQTNFKGVYTHFAAAKDLKDQEGTLSQIAEFNKVRKIILKSGFKDLTFHTAATGGTLLYPQSHFDLVRIGLGFYGYWANEEIRLQHPKIWGKKLNLKPVLSWRAIVSEVKTLSKGDCVGYDFTECVSEEIQAAIIPIGYWHGFSRSLSGRGKALIKGDYAKILGRVSMDLTVLALPRGSKVKIYDVATLIGKDGKNSITAGEFADISGTINYEIITKINPLIKKVIV